MKEKFTRRVAEIGLVAKGSVYILLGLLAFMAAFELNGRSDQTATQSGALAFVKGLPAGEVLLFAVVAGLLCYSCWRAIQAFRKNEKWKKRLRYGFSGLSYLALAGTAVKIAVGRRSSGDQNQHVATELMSTPFGPVLVGACALLLASIGGYQVYYGLSEKYRKHVQELSLQSNSSSLLLLSGKIGYISRGVVWLVIAFLFLRASVFASGSEAGNTGKAFQFIETSPMGSPLLGLLGLGLFAYGVFNFVRARYERFT
jgi:hypothetical protein